MMAARREEEARKGGWTTVKGGGKGGKTSYKGDWNNQHAQSTGKGAAYMCAWNDPRLDVHPSNQCTSNQIHVCIRKTNNRFAALGSHDEDEGNDTATMTYDAAQVPHQPTPLTFGDFLEKVKVKARKERKTGRSEKRDDSGMLAPLYTKQTKQALNKVTGPTWMSAEDGWVKISSLIDSGACDRVTPPQALPFIPVKPSEASINGQEYMSASGDDLPNLGEKLVTTVDRNGVQKERKYQVVEGLTRPLDAVSAICDEDNARVVFGKGGGFIYYLNEDRVEPFSRKGKLYELEYWVQLPKRAGDHGEISTAAPFGRLG